MNISDIAVPVVSAVLSIGAVSAFLSKYVAKIVKYVRLAADAINTLKDVANALEDGKLTPEEITQLTKDVAYFQAELKS